MLRPSIRGGGGGGVTLLPREIEREEDVGFVPSSFDHVGERDGGSASKDRDGSDVRIQDIFYTLCGLKFAGCGLNVSALI